MVAADAGATGHFLLPGNPVIDILPTLNPISINLPDGKSVEKSSHTCRINIPWLLESATGARGVPGLAQMSLILMAVLCDAGCNVTYDDDECGVYFKGRGVWSGNREPSTKLWVIPLEPGKAREVEI